MECLSQQCELGFEFFNLGSNIQHFVETVAGGCIRRRREPKAEFIFIWRLGLCCNSEQQRSARQKQTRDGMPALPLGNLAKEDATWSR